MASRAFAEALLDVYHGEQFGEAVFETMVLQAENRSEQFVLGTLLQLETEGKAIVRPALARLGCTLATNTQRRSEGRTAAGSLLDLPWADRFAAMAASIRARGLPQYEALVALVSPEEDPEAYRLAEFMGAHERAILATSERIAAGAPASLAPVIELLHFPLAAPAES